MQFVLFPNDDGSVVLLIPSGAFPTEETAKKDVPAGRPYVFIDADALPDHEFQSAWAADFSKPDGIGMGHDAWAAQYNDPEDLQMRNEAHAENAARDMYDQMYATAQQENAQFDALQALKAAS